MPALGSSSSSSALWRRLIRGEPQGSKQPGPPGSVAHHPSPKRAVADVSTVIVAAASAASSPQLRPNSSRCSDGRFSDARVVADNDVWGSDCDVGGGGRLPTVFEGPLPIPARQQHSTRPVAPVKPLVPPASPRGAPSVPAPHTYVTASPRAAMHVPGPKPMPREVYAPFHGLVKASSMPMSPRLKQASAIVTAEPVEVTPLSQNVRVSPCGRPSLCQCY